MYSYVRVAALAVSTILLVGCGGGASEGNTSGGGGLPPSPAPNPAVSDTTAPTVVSTNPPNNASAIPVNIQLSIAFSEAMNPTTLTATTVTVNQQGGGAVSGSVTYANNAAVFTPTAAFAANTRYNVVVAGTVSDVAGNALGSAHAFSFTTAPASTNGNYTISWATVSDARVAGHRLYHGTTDPLTKTNRTAVVNVGNTNSYTLAGSALGVPGQAIYFAVTAVAGDGSESPLSSQDAIVIE